MPHSESSCTEAITPKFFGNTESSPVRKSDSGEKMRITDSNRDIEVANEPPEKGKLPQKAQNPMMWKKLIDEDTDIVWRVWGAIDV